MIELMFLLKIDDGWPPVAKECLICTATESNYRVEVPPLFVKDISVGDVIEIERDEEGDVSAWSQVKRSKRSTVWIMVTGSTSIEGTIECLISMKCNVERFKEYRYFSIDVPEECSVERLDECLAALDREKVSIAFPSFRH